jgi:tetratricopeptide (TPR) repeat protein
MSKLQIFDQQSRTVMHELVSSDMDERVPTLSLHMMVKNAETVIARTLSHVLPYLSQVRIVLNDTTDRTYEVIDTTMKAWPLVSLDVQHVTSVLYPNLYIRDVPETYETGQSLAGESVQGMFSGELLLCDWSAVRNLGWDSHCDYRLQLDADDLLVKPEELPFALRACEHTGADLAASHYQIFGSTRRVYRERLARNTPIIRWDGKVHETLTGGLRRVLLEDLLITIDKRDNNGTDIRVPARDFKTLYYLARQARWQVSPRHLAYLIQEARHVMPMAWVSNSLVPCYVAATCGTGSRDEKSWVYGMVGEAYEESGQYDEACKWYQQAVEALPTRGMCWRLSRALYSKGAFEQCLAMYHQGQELPKAGLVMDLAPIPEFAMLVLVAHSLSQVGQHAEALGLIKLVRTKVDSSTLQALEEHIASQAGTP